MITEELTEAAAARVERMGVDEQCLTELRREFPDTHFTYCMDDDLPNHTPVLERPGFNIYLVDGREHCLRLTDRREDATGIVVAEVIDE